MRLVDSPPTAAGNRVPAPIRLDDLLAATGGRLQAPTTVRSFRLAVVDSRKVVPGSLFVALPGSAPTATASCPTRRRRRGRGARRA